MASKTKKRKIRKKINLARAGKVRKNLISRKGSTAPLLPLNKPNAHELAAASK